MGAGDDALGADAAGYADAGVLAAPGAGVGGAVGAPLPRAALLVRLAAEPGPVAAAGDAVALVSRFALAGRSSVRANHALLLLRLGAGDDLAGVQAGAAAVDVDLANQSLNGEEMKDFH